MSCQIGSVCICAETHKVSNNISVESLRMKQFISANQLLFFISSLQSLCFIYLFLSQAQWKHSLLPHHQPMHARIRYEVNNEYFANKEGSIPLILSQITYCRRPLSWKTVKATHIEFILGDKLVHLYTPTYPVYSNLTLVLPAKVRNISVCPAF